MTPPPIVRPRPTTQTATVRMTSAEVLEQRIAILTEEIQALAIDRDRHRDLARQADDLAAQYGREIENHRHTLQRLAGF